MHLAHFKVLALAINTDVIVIGPSMRKTTVAWGGQDAKIHTWNNNGNKYIPPEGMSR